MAPRIPVRGGCGLIPAVGDVGDRSPARQAVHLDRAQPLGIGSAAKSSERACSAIVTVRSVEEGPSDPLKLFSMLVKPVECGAG